MNQNKNIYWINAVKALSVIAVFFVHCQLYNSSEMKF
jgi:surface polysaccharide O-acyltransferase-like enzyme